MLHLAFRLCSPPRVHSIANYCLPQVASIIFASPPKRREEEGGELGIDGAVARCRNVFRVVLQIELLEDKV